MEICIKTNCTGCESCVQACPTNSIKMVNNSEGFKYPLINEKTCIHCNKCRRVCPNNNTIEKHETNFYMGWHKDINVLQNSSSGGAYTALAEYFLQEDGIVFGAYFDDTKREVYHIKVLRKEDLYKTRLSKYYQGSLNQTYGEVKKYLNEGKLVLFSGTACQIAGLYCFLGKKYSTLYTVDILCHGITSKNVVDAYIKSKEKKYKKKVKTFRFRLKPNDSPWCKGGGTRMRIDFCDGSHVIEDKATDTFFIGFNDYLFLRESCYACRYTGCKRISDFTIADYWGVTEEEVGKKQMDYGVSLILVNTEKGEKVLETIKNSMEIKKIDGRKAVQYNQALEKPGYRNSRRDLFFSQIETSDYDKLIRTYYKGIFIKKGIRKLLGDKLYDRIKTTIKYRMH